MIKCFKCEGRMFIDRQYTTIDHIEIYCMKCGSRKFFHPPSETAEGSWLLKREKLRAKVTMSHL
jgi:predicted  nucleic acid-binding Zn-ribbon protein